MENLRYQGLFFQDDRHKKSQPISGWL